MGNKAIIAKVEAVHAIPNADKIQIAIVLGEQCVVSKDVGVGYVGILFPEGLQLSEEYCHENNLYRKADKNKDNTKTGFFEESRRVRAQPFLKVKSTAYFASLESLEYIGPMSMLWLIEVGTELDELMDKKICQKYYSPATLKAMKQQGIGPNLRSVKKKIESLPYFEKHVDSAQFKHFVSSIPTGALVHFHAKVHGTSARMSHTYKRIEHQKFYRKEITIKLPFLKRFKFNVTVPNWKGFFLKDRQEPTFVVGTRNVVLDAPEKEGFHGSEAFRFEVLESIKHAMPLGMTVYGEIAGYTNGKPIMAVHSAQATKSKDFVKKYGEQITYSYGCKPHEYRFHVYRITMLGSDGVNRDFSQAQVEEWCAKNNVATTYTVHEPVIYDGNSERLAAVVEYLTERPELLGEDYIDPSHPSEGVILRVDTGSDTPKFYKSKSYFFRVMEGHCEAEDTEDAS